MKSFALFFLILLIQPSDGATFEELSARATAARNANEVSRAIELYKQAVEVNPEWLEGWWFLGTFLYDTAQYAGAREAFQGFVKINAQSGPAWGLLGLCEFQTGDYSQALTHLQRSLALGSGSEPQIGEVLRYHEALLLTRNGSYDAALGKFVPFVRSGMQNEPLLYGLGLAALRLPLTPKEIRVDQQELIMTAGKAAFLMIARDSGKAEQSFHDLLTHYPKTPNVHYLYGCYLYQSDPDRSMAELKRELEVTPGNSAARSMLAWEWMMRGDYAAALPYAEKAAQDDPASSNAQYVLGRVLVETGKIEHGIQYLESAVKMDPTNLENHVALATAYPRAGRYQDAKRERRQALELSKEMDRIAQ